MDDEPHKEGGAKPKRIRKRGGKPKAPKPPKPDSVEPNVREKAKRKKDGSPRDPDSLAKILTEDRLPGDQWEAFRQEMIAGSDRAAAVVGASYVETMLDVAIVTHLTNIDEEAYQELTKASGPMHSLCAKTILGYSMGLYDWKTKEDLDTLRNIRNKFAHRLNASSFKEEDISRLCYQFNNPIAAKVIEAKDKMDPEAKSHNLSIERVIFIRVVLEAFDILNKAADHDLKAWVKGRNNYLKVLAIRGR
ncbi:MAG: hypothetical protein AB7O49_21825 [Sphingomonadales bacterium]